MIAAAVLALAAVAPAPCVIAGTTTANRLADLPPSVRDELGRFFKPGYDLADAGASYNATDVVSSTNPLPQRRLLRAIGGADRWIVWYEHGGIGHHLHATGIVIRRCAGSEIATIQPLARYGGSMAQLCSASRSWLGPNPVETATDD